LPQPALVLTVIAGKHRLFFSPPPQATGFLNYLLRIVETEIFLRGKRKEQLMAFSNICSA